LVANASVTEGVVSEDVLAFFKIAKETARTRQGESWFGFLPAYSQTSRILAFIYCPVFLFRPDILPVTF